MPVLVDAGATDRVLSLEELLLLERKRASCFGISEFLYSPQVPQYKIQYILDADYCAHVTQTDTLLYGVGGTLHVISGACQSRSRRDVPLGDGAMLDIQLCPTQHDIIAFVRANELHVCRFSVSAPVPARITHVTDQCSTLIHSLRCNTCITLMATQCHC